MTNSIIFIGSPEKSSKNCTQNLKHLFFVSPRDAIFRIFAAFVPPLTRKYQKVYVDFQGPLFALLILAGLINYGNSFKATDLFISPSELVLLYGTLMPILCFLVCKVGRSSITFCEITSLIGYGLYGHILTLVLSFLCFQERSNFFFFICLVFFGGLSTLRIALVVLRTLLVPAARLLICSLISIVNILFLIFIHFAYMHQTFIYKAYSGVSH